MNSSLSSLDFRIVKPRAQRGLSLVELMIAITLGLLVVGTLSVFFVDQSRARSELDKANRMIDNGRYAMDLLSENLRVAGFFDTYVPTGTASSTDPDPCSTTVLTGASNLDVLLRHVQGFPAGAGAAGVISAPPCGLSPKTGSDVLVLRRTSTAAPVTVAAAGMIYLQVSKCASDSVKYQIAGTVNAAIHDKNCATAAALRPFMVQVYYVSADNNPGDGIPTLKRRELDTDPASATAGTFVTTPLVEGIEYFRIDYGVDTNGDGAADSYKRNPAPTEWPDVMSLRISLIARNLETSVGHSDTKVYTLGGAGTFGPFNDGYKRHAFTQTVRLVNPSSRREVP